VNEKNSIAQSVTKVKAIERINRNPERSTEAPPVPYNPIPSPYAREKPLQGQLPQPPQIDVSQSLTICTHPTPEPMLNLENEGSSYQTGSTSVTRVPKRKAPSTDEQSARKKRTCQKCGQPGCSGSNSRRFCKNPCQDCGQDCCPGRNSQHPKKDCREGWNFHHKPLQL
jgi:hypothetical protein